MLSHSRRNRDGDSNCQRIAANEVILSFPGKEFGIFCSNFISSISVTINVSGSRGGDGKAHADIIAGSNGQPGTQAGKVWFYVENASEDLAKKVRILAYGGDGGIGGKVTEGGTDKKAVGANGGSGGDGGSIEVMFGTIPRSSLSYFIDTAASSWVGRAQNLFDHFLPNLETFPSDKISPDEKNNFKTTLSDYISLSIALQSCLNANQRMQNQRLANETTSESIPELVVSAKSLKAVIQKLLSEPPGSALSDDVALLNDITYKIEDWTIAGDETAGGKLVALIKKVNQRLENLVSTDNSALADALTTIKGLLYFWNGSISDTAWEVRGGYGPNAESEPGAQGSDGKAGKVVSRTLALTRNQFDLNSTAAYAFPEQCQMLLDEADRLYFTNGVDATSEAARLYQTLCSRLAFAPSLENAKSTDDEDSRPLSRAYFELENISRVTIAPITQLRDIRLKAESQLQKIQLGKDAFGHGHNWVPRQTISAYKDQVSKMILDLSDLEKNLKDFAESFAQQQDAKSHIKNAIAANKEATDRIEDQIHKIDGENGLLHTYATKIAFYTPVLRRGREAISKQLDTVKGDIQRKINFSLDMIIDSISTLVEGLNPQSALKLAQIGYKAATTVQGLKGDNVDKEYVVEQIETLKGDLSSLVATYCHRENGEIDAQDPNGIKIMAESNKIKEIINEFKSAIPEKHRKGLSAALDDYMDNVATRNKAVMDYNAALALLLQSSLDLKKSRHNLEILGDDASNLNPNLPFAFQWLKGLKSSLHVDIMQRMNYENRATAFWGLMDPWETPFSKPGPLRNVTDLKNNQRELDKRFDRAKEDLGGTIWQSFAPNQSKTGRLYKLSPEETNQLLKPKESDLYEGLQKYETWVKLTPQRVNALAQATNVRLSQVRFWLLNAQVTPDDASRQLLTVKLQHSGVERMRNRKGKHLEYEHSGVYLDFTYDTTTVKSTKDCTDMATDGQQEIERDYGNPKQAPEDKVYAPIGPFTDWHVVIFDTPDRIVDLTGVKDCYIEFCGRYLPLELKM
ncbi:hypothetical protein ABW20_dc0101176 [Dactylellina cionopaga]|nr:hypothetical protein ABW20_dc0101176 [Dactylellina cionopaga]